jgi:putative nucleotidyltransferase with HDIG domain
MNLAALKGVGGVCCAVVAAGVLALPHYSTDLWPALVLLFIGVGILGMPIVEQLTGLAGGATGAARRPSSSPRLVEAALRGLPQAVIVLNDEKVALWNAAAERLFGWSARETVGRPLPFALGGGAVPSDAAEAAARPRTKAGAPIDDAVVSSLLRDPQGRVTGRMLVFMGPAGIARQEDRDPSQASLLEAPKPITVTGSSATDISTVLDIRNRLQIQSHVASVSKALSRLAPSAEVMKTVGEAALSLGKADRAAVYLRQPDGAVSCPWSRGLSEAYVAQVIRYARAIADGRIMDWTKPDLLEISGRGIEGSAPLLYSDVAALPHGAAVPKLTQVEGYRALANWPLTREGEILGLVSCYYNTPRRWTEIEQEAFRAFSLAAADAIDNGRRYDEQAQRATDLEVFFDLSKRLRVAQNPEAIYPILVGQAMDLIRAEKGMLFLLEPRGAGFKCVYMAGLPPEARGEAFPTSGSAFGKVSETGAPYRTDNLGGEPLPVWLNAYRSIGPAAIVPVRSETEIIGTLALGRDRGPAARPFADAEIRLLEGIADIGGTAVRRAKLFQNLENSYLQMVLSLARTMDARDHYTSGHSERIAVWAEEVARQLGCDEAAVQEIRWGALLHDIGKIGVPDEILRKPSHLTEEEWVVMRQHPIIGEEILASTDRMRGVARIVRHHQEKWNGTGYPDKLRGQEIPLGARILAVVDSYSAITDDRPYKKARSHEAAIAELRRCAGTQFDPEVVDAFRRVVHRARAQPGRAQ